MKILAIALLCVWGGGAVAQEERAIDNFAGVGVRAMGMGGAFVGVADDFTAMYWNPAGLAQMQQREVQVSFLRNSRANDSVFNGTPGSSELTNTRFGSLGFVYPYPVYRGSLVLAAGFNRTKDFDWNLSQKGEARLLNGTLQADNSFQHEGELGLWGVSAAVDVSPAISLGATLGLVSGENEIVGETDWVDLQDTTFVEDRFLTRYTFTDEYKWTPYAVLGAMLRTPRDKPRYRLGATFATGGVHKIRYVFRGPFSYGEPNPCQHLLPEDAPDLSLEADYGSVKCDDGTVKEFGDEEVSNTYQLALPFEFGVGASAEALPGLILAGSLHLAEWSQSEYKGADDWLRANNEFETQYRNAWRYHFGVEYQVPVVALDLRAGYFVDPIPFVGDDPLRIDIDKDRHFITLGAGILLDEAVQVDLAWMRGTFKQVEVEAVGDSEENRLISDQTINRLVVGMGYNF